MKFRERTRPLNFKSAKLCKLCNSDLPNFIELKWSHNPRKCQENEYKISTIGATNNALSRYTQCLPFSWSSSKKYEYWAFPRKTLLLFSSIGIRKQHCNNCCEHRKNVLKGLSKTSIISTTTLCDSNGYQPGASPTGMPGGSRAPQGSPNILFGTPGFLRISMLALW